MSNQYILSIIVPVYNVEEYIEKCISSLLNQKAQNYEIIIVNDGTQDNSIDIIKDKFTCQRIRIIHQENQGLSAARNTGLKNARGEYVWFFDSDDWISKDVLEDIISSLQNCDILYFKSYYTEKKEETRIYDIENTEHIGKLFVKNRFHHGAPFYIYKKKLLISNSFYFEKGIYHEDTLFTPQTIYHSENIVQYNKPVYHRLIRENSITTTINPKRCYDLCFVITKLHAFTNNNIKDKEKYRWSPCIADAINECLHLALKCDSKVQADISSFFIKNKTFINYLCNSNKLPTKILGYITSYTKLSLFSIYKFLYNFRYSS